MPTHHKGHRLDTSSVTIWVKDDILEKWDAFCEKKGKNRSALIKDAVNDYITSHDIDSKVETELAAAKIERQQLIEKMDEFLKQRAEVNKVEPKANESAIRHLILDLLAEKSPNGLTGERLAYFVQMNYDQLIDILAILKENGDIKIRYNKDQEGEYYVESDN